MANFKSRKSFKSFSLNCLIATTVKHAYMEAILLSESYINIHETNFLFTHNMSLEQSTSNRRMSCHVMPCHAMSFHLMPCHLMPCHVISCHAWKKQPTGFKASPEATVFGLRNSMNHSVSCVKQSMAYVMSLDIMMSATCAMQHIACNAWHLQNGNMECPPDIHCNFIMANHVSHDSKPMVHGQPGFMHEKGFF